MQVTGICTIKANGKLLRSNSGASISLGGKTRTAIMGYKFYGFSEAVTNAEVDCTVTHTGDTDLLEMNEWTDVTLLFETDTGKSYLVSHAFTVEPVKLTGGNGEVSLRMSGEAAEEI